MIMLNDELDKSIFLHVSNRHILSLSVNLFLVMSTTYLSSDWEYIRDKDTGSDAGFVLEFRLLMTQTADRISKIGLFYYSWLTKVYLNIIKHSVTILIRTHINNGWEKKRINFKKEILKKYSDPWLFGCMYFNLKIKFR